MVTEVRHRQRQGLSPQSLSPSPYLSRAGAKKKLQGWAEGHTEKLCEESPDFWVLYQPRAELRTIQLIQLLRFVPAGKLRPTSQQSEEQD